MTPGFNANVAARKPRTGIGRVISDLTSQPQEEGEGHVAEATADTIPRIAPSVPVAPPVEETVDERPPRASRGREQVERLRERLAVAARPPLGAAEPDQTAAAVKDLVDGLRARLESVVRERSELARALEEARGSLARTQADLQRERRMHTALEAQAEERRRIADDAVAEAEALAAERDQVLRDLEEHRRLESEQSALLLEAEAALGRRDSERTAAARELAEARGLLDLRTVQCTDAEARLEEAAADRARAQARCRELEAEVARLRQASDALDSIDAIVHKGR